MSAIEFMDSLSFAHVMALALLQAAAFFMLYGVAKNRQPGFLDPFTLTIFFSASAWSTVLFLYFTDRCSARLLMSFLLTNVAFFVAYLAAAPRYSRFGGGLPVVGGPQTTLKFKIFGLIVCSLYFSFMAYNLAVFGFGIQHEARLEIYTNSQGLGILKRGMDALMPAAIFVLVRHALREHHFVKICSYILLLLIFANTVLDGSKSGIVQFALVCVVSVAWFRKWGYLPRVGQFSFVKFVIFAVVAVLVAGAVLAIQMDAYKNFESLRVVGSILLFRLLVAGDIFILAYPNEIIDKIALAYHPLVILFNDPISVFRLMKIEVVPLGNQLYNYFLTDRLVESGGPNSHLAIYSYYLFGDFGGPIFSGIFGLLYGAIRRGVWIAKGGRLVAGAVYVTLLSNASAILIDPSYSVIRLTNILIFLIPVALVFSFTLKVRHEDRGNSAKLV